MKLISDEIIIIRCAVYSRMPRYKRGAQVMYRVSNNTSGSWGLRPLSRMRAIKIYLTKIKKASDTLKVCSYCWCAEKQKKKMESFYFLFRAFALVDRSYQSDSHCGCDALQCSFNLKLPSPPLLPASPHIYIP